ncbi:terminase large subunit domain-containing protein [Mesorhizobium sp. Cs1321R2N1]|uniref:terminase large subunit domain-containing protein n=1 Tax=Mesorhizobium sp. Cs1321R2N1 TaxID=3015174 RepID=UPI00301CC90E
MNILQACADPNLFGPWFRRPETWRVWFTYLAVLFGLPLDDDQLALFRHHTGRLNLPSDPATESWLVVGRRGGKSFVMALIAVYLACFRQYRHHLQPGERATILVIAADRRQARTIMRYVRGLLTNIPILSTTVKNETAEAFELNNAVTIEVGTASHRSTRGYTFAAVLCDELAFWRTDDSAEPDYAILDAIRPGMATIPGAMLLCASSPYARRGALWDAYRLNWAQEAGPLVWRATTLEMNPSVPRSVIDEAIRRDAASARAEYMAEFRTDMEMLLTRESVAACVSPGVRERPPVARARYVAFVDPSGGSADSMTLAIAHAEGDDAVLDAVREVTPPFSPEAVVSTFAALIRSYGIRSVTGDRYGGEFPRELFRRYGVDYCLSDRTRSDLYLALVPAINSRRVDLLDLTRLESQLVGLERRTSRSGRDIVDHSPGSHDDLANAVAGAVALASSAGRAAVLVGAIGGYGGSGPISWREVGGD